MPPRALRPPATALTVVLSLALAGPAAAAPAISGADGDVWNAADEPPTYVVTGSVPGASVRWELRRDGAAVPGQSGSGESPLTVTLAGAPDGALQLVAGQVLPADPAPATRSFTLDTTPPGISIVRPAAGAQYAVGATIPASYSCTAATSCTGTVPDGDPLDTSSAGDRTLTVRATDAAGNAAQARRAYRVVAPAAAGAPAAPAPVIRLAPTRPGTPVEPVMPVVRASRLHPRAGAALTIRRPVLRWPRVAAARLYNLQLFRVRGTRATKILSDFPTDARERLPAGLVTPGGRYLWRVWPLVRSGYPAQPLGQSWFDARRPVRLRPSQLRINQRVSQAALRRTAAVSAWVDAGIVSGDLRDGGLGPAEFGPDVRLTGTGAPIADGLATPRPIVTPSPRRRTAPLRLTVGQLLVNQRIAQAAVRRANALARRLDGGLTGGDLRAGVVGPAKLAPGLGVASAVPAGPLPPPSATRLRNRRRPHGHLRLDERQLLVNQRISQAAVRRANALLDLIEGGLTGRQFEDGSVTAADLSPELRPD